MLGCNAQDAQEHILLCGGSLGLGSLRAHSTHHQVEAPGWSGAAMERDG